MSEPRITFYDWPYSPFCMKVRAILDHKGARYARVNPLAARGKLTREGTGKVPAVEIDGRFVADSTDIAYAIDEVLPEPPLLPANRRDRALCHAIEDWADESLYFIGLYYRWYDKEGRKPIPLAFGKSLKGRAAYRFYLYRVLRQLRGQGTLRKARSHVGDDLKRHLDAIEGLLDGKPYVLGGDPFLCDFALWGQLNYLRRTPVGARTLEGRLPVTAFIDRIVARAR